MSRSLIATPVLVTGGAGFIGANLCRALLEHGAPKVIVIDDLSTGFRSNLDGLDVEFIEGSVLDGPLLNDVITAGTAVVHLAARPSVPRSVVDPVRSHDVNATGTLCVLEAARTRGAVQVIIASSSSVYGDHSAPFKHEELPVAPRSPYGASKLAAEAYSLAYQRTYGLATLAFRFFNVYGPLQAAGHAYAAVIPAFIDAALNGRPLPIHGDGSQSRDFTFVATVTNAICQAINGRLSFDGPVNLAFGSSASLLDLVKTLERVVGRELDCEHLPSRVGDVKRSRAAGERLASILPDVQPFELADGVGRTFDWALAVDSARKASLDLQAVAKA